MRALRCLLLTLALIAGSSATAAAAGAPLQGAPELAKAYDAILDADFDAASRLIEAACPPAPEEACLTLEATRLLWRIQLDPQQQLLDGPFIEAVETAIAAAEQWAEREPERAEARLYVGGALGARVQWRILRRQHVAAARDGKRIKAALQEALRLDPSLVDAQFGLGLYEYYTDVAPTAAKIVRFLLLLPGGDRARGLARMRLAQTDAVLLADEAAYQLHLILLWYENAPGEALEILRDLSQRHPENPLFHRRIAETLDVYFHDVTASRDAYRRLLALALARDVHEPELAEAEARLGLAAALDAMGDTDLAVDELTTLLARAPSQPWAATARAQLALGYAYDRVGDRSKARALFSQIIASPPVPDPSDLATMARRALRRPTPLATGEAHRLAIDAWRTFEDAPEESVELVFEKALALDPHNPIARYRYGRVLAAHGELERALAALEGVVRAAATTPPVVLAEAALAAGRLRERTHDVAAAIDHYRRAAHTFGASTETRSSATEALARLEQLPPRR